MRSQLVIAGLAVMLLFGAAAGSADPDPPELVVIVHPDNAAKISPTALERYFLKKERHWGGDGLIVPITAPHESDVRKHFDRVVLGMSAQESARYWIDLRIRSGETAPKELADPLLTTRLVGRLKGAIAYVPATTPLAGVRIVGRIRGGKLLPP